LYFGKQESAALIGSGSSIVPAAYSTLHTRHSLTKASRIKKQKPTTKLN